MPPFPRILCFSLISLLSTNIAHASSFKPNCTLPPMGTNYVSGPNMRGTISILWNCLSIIFLCTWSIQHLNIPAMRPETDNTLQKIWWAVLDSRTKIKWMIFTVLVPEYIIGRALNELRAATDGSSSWHKIQVYMANMGYFVLDFEDYWTEVSGSNTVRRVEEGDLSSTFKSRSVEPGYSLQQTVADVAKELETGHASASERLNLSRLTHRYWALSSKQLCSLIPHIIDPPKVQIREMEVLNRGNALVKALALIQVTYLSVQLVARKVARLPSAQLEIGALAFSASSFITYALYWDRPQGVESVLIIKPNCAPSKATIKSLTRNGQLFLWSHPRPEYKFEKLYDVIPIPNDGLQQTTTLLGIPDTLYYLAGNNEEILVLTAGAFLGGTVFGGLHCLAWNFHFPTHGEALTWRVCSVVTSVLPLLCVVPMILWMRWHPWHAKPERSPAVRFALGLILLVGFLIPYVLARMFLIFEMFRSLFFLPPEAFIDTWSVSFPHWG